MSKHKHRNNNNMNNEELTEEELKAKADQENIKEKADAESNSENKENLSEENVADNAETDEKSEENKNASESKEEEKDPLKVAEEKIEELQDKYLRSRAEFENYRKRTLKEKAELILNGGEKTISAILPVIDDMERAIVNADKVEDIKAMKEGLELIYQKFQKTLEGLGLKKIETEGLDFDTDFHEAIAMIPGGDEKKGKILDCVQSGYKLNDKVIRHAKVAVGQ